MADTSSNNHSPPDGGYGWVIVTASFIAHIIQYGVVWTVGIFYVVFLETVDASKPAIALISALNTTAYLVTGPLSGMLTNSYGHRAVTIAGGILASIGLFLSVFSTSVYHFYCTYSILTGVGLGLAYIPTISIVAVYFDKKRTVAFGLAASGVGLGTFVFTIIIQFLIDTYGWRSALLLLSGICMNTCVCGALYCPLRVDKGVEKSNTANPPKLKKQWRSVLKLSIFKNGFYLLVCLNNLLFMFGLAVVYVHLPEYATTLGFTSSQGAWLFSVLGLANFLGRIAFGFFAHTRRLNAILLYVVGFLLTGAVTLLTPLAKTLLQLMMSAGVFGFLSAAIGPLLPEVVIRTLDPLSLTCGYGYIMVFEAMGNLAGPTAAAWVYVQTDMYQTSFYLGGSAIVVSALVMIPLSWRTQNMAICQLDTLHIEEKDFDTRKYSTETIEEYI